MPELPTGTVTFLFTDIEGSTTRWERHPAAMQAALARHDAILREAIEGHGGVVFKTVGDAFYAAFVTATDALAAALAAQHALQAEPWPEALGPVRVRMALHTGAAQQRDGDYFGPPLNRVARLLSAGHGGQVLLSEVAQGLVRDQRLVGVELRDLGEHRLKDLQQPEHIFQVVAPDLPAAFPPLKTLEHRPNNLPLQPTPFIGREREVATVRQRLLQPEVRLLTLTGPGGTGKTRLSLQVAADLLDDFPDGVFFVELAPISDSTLVASTIAQTMGVTETAGTALIESLKSFLREKTLLLLLDNFEQVLPAAPVVAELVAAAPRLKVLVTSRAVLGLYGEHHFLVPPLQFPDTKHLPSLERLSQYEAVRLFIERARASRADFAVTNENAPAVVEICARLDGLPLAIELAAARIRILQPQALLQRLTQRVPGRLTLLTGGGRDLPARQQTLRGAIEWSYSLLDPAEQMLFARLGVFVGGYTLEAVEAACNADGVLDVDILDAMMSLLDKSLMRREEGPDGEPRFVMLETIHEYARERLEASGEAEAVRRHHAVYFLHLVEQAEPQLDGAEQTAWLARLTPEHDNLRAALQWTLATREAELALRLAGALAAFWSLSSQFTEGRKWLALTLPAHDAAPALRAKALIESGWLAYVQSDHEHASLAVEESLGLYRQVGDKRGQARALRILAAIHMSERRYEHAGARLEEALALSRELGDTHGIATSLNNAGDVALDQGDYVMAQRLFEESLAHASALGNKLLIETVLTNLGRAALYQGQYVEARPHFRESLALCQELGDTLGIAYDLEGLAGVAAGQHALERSARLWGAAEALREALGSPPPQADQAEYGRMIKAARATVDAATWDRAWAEGREMRLEQAMAYALEETGDA